MKKAFLAIGIFFALFFVAIVYTVRLAFHNYEPPTDPAYHEKGLDYQKRNDEFHRATERGWTARINLFEKETVRSGMNTLNIVMEKDPSKPYGNSGEASRTAVLVSVSHPASIVGGRKFEFPVSDFVMNGNRWELTREVDVPLTGTAEISVEVRPDTDSAIYNSRKLTVN